MTRKDRAKAGLAVPSSMLTRPLEESTVKEPSAWLPPQMEAWIRLAACARAVAWLVAVVAVPVTGSGLRGAGRQAAGRGGVRAQQDGRAGGREPTHGTQ